MVDHGGRQEIPEVKGDIRQAWGFREGEVHQEEE